MPLETSILKTIRKRIGPSADYDIFDTDLIININSSFARLCQLGVGPSKPFKIEGADEEWDEFITKPDVTSDVQQYIFLKARLIFDPPQNATVTNLIKEEIEKLEWLLKEVSEFGY